MGQPNTTAVARMAHPDDLTVAGATADGMLANIDQDGFWRQSCVSYNDESWRHGPGFFSHAFRRRHVKHRIGCWRLAEMLKGR